MFSRVVSAAAMSTVTWVLVAPAVGAQTYPPVPAPVVRAAVPKTERVSPVVVVQDVPAPRTHALVRTGTSSTMPLIAFGSGSLLLGGMLAAAARRRHSAVQTPPHTD
jgi:hypothetical protein